MSDDDDYGLLKGETLTAEKARQILRDGSVRGHALSPQQKRFLGLIAGGGHPTRLEKGIRLIVRG
jgi:hypothetical protein